MITPLLTILVATSTPTDQLQTAIDAGLAALKHKKPEVAAEAFAKALSLSDAPELHLYLAHAHLGVQRYQDALAEVTKAAPLAETHVAQPLIEARARRGLEDEPGAYRVLWTAAERFKNEPRPLLELVDLMHSRKLDGSARRHAESMLRFDLDRDTVLALFHLLYRDQKAFPILERLAASRPSDPEVRSHLAHAYAAADRPLTAGRLFEEAARLGGNFAWESANQYALAGRHDRALRMNGWVLDGERKHRQRIEILFAQRRYSRVIALKKDSPHPGIRYRLAYAHYALGQHARASTLARSLLGTRYQDPAKSLLKTMGRAVEAP